MARHRYPAFLWAALIAALVALIGCGGGGGGGGGTTATNASNSSTASTATTSGVTPLPGFTETPLISDQAGVAPLTDPHLINPWGLAFAPSGPFWTADNGSNLAGIYAGGNVGGGTMTNDSPAGIGIPFNNPTGQVFNATTDFGVTNAGVTAPALFIFSSETGWIDAWNGASGSSAVAEAVVAGAVYKGLAIGSNATGNFLYATNFSAGTIDVFDKSFTKTTLSGSFSDASIPSGYAPFGIVNVNGTLYVSYALQDAAKHDDVPGAGHGYIDAFDTNGNLLGRVTSQGKLNSPWGMVMTPASFGSAGNMLLVGNFGDGRINAFSISGTSATYVGTLADSSSTPLQINGLWDLKFGNGASAGDATSLYFSAGPGGETHGLFGRLNAPATPKAPKKK